MEKNFIDWHTLKEWLHDDHHKAPTFQQREIWWCSVGANIGHETDGKGKQYSRPVLIIRKFNQRFFYGVPLTTQAKDNPYYFRLCFHGRNICAILSQARAFDSKRLTDQMGKLSRKQFNQLREALATMLLK